MDAGASRVAPMTNMAEPTTMSERDAAIETIYRTAEDWRHMIAIDPWVFAERIYDALEGIHIADARPAGDQTVTISVEAKEILDRILYKHSNTYAFLEPLRDALATPAPDLTEGGEQ